MSAETIVAAGRVFSERMMTTVCVIERETTVQGNLDPVTKRQIETFDPIWGGPCRVKSVSASGVSSSRETEGQLTTVQQLELYVPVDGTGTIAVDDRVTVTDGGFDAALTGQQFRISGLFQQSYATARRLPMEAIA